MKTYHEYQNESKQAEAKLKYVQSQKPKFDKIKSKKKLKQYEKQVEKRQQKYTETKVKAFKARNEYILSINSANACISKYSTEDIGDLVDVGFKSLVNKPVFCIVPDFFCILHFGDFLGYPTRNSNSKNSINVIFQIKFKCKKSNKITFITVREYFCCNIDVS
jgi:hypothetical protein